MAKWYKATKHGRQVVPVTVTRATPTTIYIDFRGDGVGLSHPKETEHTKYFPSYKEAYKQLVEFASRNLTEAFRAVERAKNQLDAIQASFDQVED